MNDPERKNSLKSTGLNTNTTNSNIPLPLYENKLLPESLLKDIYNDDEDPLTDESSDDGYEDHHGKFLDTRSTVPSQPTSLSSNTNLSQTNQFFEQFASMGISNKNFSPEIRMRQMNPPRFKTFSDNNLKGRGDFINLNNIGRPRFDSNFSLNSSDSNLGSSYSGNFQGGLNMANNSANNSNNFNSQYMVNNRGGYNPNFRQNSNFNQNFINYEEEQLINGIKGVTLTGQNFCKKINFLIKIIFLKKIF
jgi:hypothetical protein